MAASFPTRMPHHAAARTRPRQTTFDGSTASPSRSAHYPDAPVITASLRRAAFVLHRCCCNVATFVAIAHIALLLPRFLTAGRPRPLPNRISHPPSASYRVRSSRAPLLAVFAHCCLQCAPSMVQHPWRVTPAAPWATFRDLLSPAHRTHVPRLSSHEPSAHARTVAHAAGLRTQQSERAFSIPTLSPHVHGARTNTRTLATASLSFLATSLRACTMPRGLAYRET